MENEERLLGIKEFAARTNYSERRIRDYCVKGRIDAHKLTDRSRKWIIPESEVCRLLGKDVPVEEIDDNDSIVNVVAPGEAVREQLANALRINDHHKELIETATTLLGYLIDTEVNQTEEEKLKELKYTIWLDGYSYGVTGKQLSDSLKLNKEYFLESPTLTSKLNNLIIHLGKEDSLIAGEGFDVISEHYPYTTINLLKELIRGKTFKGTCPVCEDWH